MSNILAIFKLVANTIPFTNKNIPNKIMKDEEMILNVAKSQNEIAIKRSNNPNILIIISFLNEMGFLNYRKLSYNFLILSFLEQLSKKR